MSIARVHICQWGIGIGPPRAQSGDAACVLLGCKAPILLHPVSTVINSGFTGIGERYIRGLDDGVTLLGPLPSDWRIILGNGPSGYAAVPSYKNLRTNGVAGDDPRLTALPEEWRKISREREPADPALFQTYKNFHTGEVIIAIPG